MWFDNQRAARTRRGPRRTMAPRRTAVGALACGLALLTTMATVAVAGAPIAGALPPAVSINPSEDKFSFATSVTGIDTDVSAEVRYGDFVGDITRAIGAQQMAAGHAVILHCTDSEGGGLAGYTLLIVDANGTAGFQYGGDYAIFIPNVELTLDNFS